MLLAPLSLADPEERRRQQSADLTPSEYPLHLELGLGGGTSHWWKIIAASLAVHLLLLSFATKLPTFVALREPKPVIVHRIPLYFPRDALTQKAPNKREITKQVDLAALLDLQTQQAQRESPDHSVRQFEMPKTAPKPQNVKAPVAILPDAPAVATNQTAAPPIPGAVNGLASAPPPAPTTSPGPFQNIGSAAPPPEHPKIAPPRATVEDAINGLAQSGAGSHVIISDDSPTQGAPPAPGTVGQLGAQHAGVELKSDPQGIDMRPYLAQILTIVRAQLASGDSAKCPHGNHARPNCSRVHHQPRWQHSQTGDRGIVRSGPAG